MKTIIEIKTTTTTPTLEEVKRPADTILYNTEVIKDVKKEIKIINENIEEIDRLREDILCDKEDLKSMFSFYDYRYYGIDADYIEPRQTPKHYRYEDDEICYYTKKTIIRGLKEKRKAKIRKLFSCGGHSLDSMIESRYNKIAQLEEEIEGLKNQKHYAYSLLNEYKN